MYQNVLNISSREAFRVWLAENGATEKECYVCAKRGRPTEEKILWYVDAVEEALCFGWIDSTVRNIDGKVMQRFSPRQPKSNWTELNKERVRRLEKMGLMTDAGRAVAPSLDEVFTIDKEVELELRKAGVWEIFQSFPPLYQRVRSSNLVFYRRHSSEIYETMLQNVIEAAKQGKTHGEWSDYGRLLDY